MQSSETSTPSTYAPTALRTRKRTALCLAGPIFMISSQKLFVGGIFSCFRNSTRSSPALSISVRDGWSSGSASATPRTLRMISLRCASDAVPRSLISSNMPQSTAYCSATALASAPV